MSTPARSLPRDLATYRIVAIVTGIGLLFLVLVAMPLRYIWDKPTLSQTYSPIHGVIFMVYVVVVVWLASRRHWAVGRTLLVIVAGAIPFASFVVERRIVAEELAKDADDADAAAADSGQPSG